MKKIGMLACLLYGTLLLHAQEQADLNVQFDFDKKTEVKEIMVPITPYLEAVSFQFSGKIESGSLIVRILDPNGKKVGAFQLESLTRKDFKDKLDKEDPENNTYRYSIIGDSSTLASGSMRKELSRPLKGLWKVEITVTKVTGMLVSNIRQKND